MRFRNERLLQVLPGTPSKSTSVDAKVIFDRNCFSVSYSFYDNQTPYNTLLHFIIFYTCIRFRVPRNYNIFTEFRWKKRNDVFGMLFIRGLNI